MVAERIQIEAEVKVAMNRDLKEMSNEQLLLLAAVSTNATRMAVNHELAVRRGNEVINGLLRRNRRAVQVAA